MSTFWIKKGIRNKNNPFDKMKNKEVTIIMQYDKGLIETKSLRII